MSYNTQESLCQQAAESFSVQSLALYIAERKGENARPIKGGAEWQVGNKAGSNSLHVRMCNGKAVATDWALDGRQKDAIDWIMELEGIRDVGEAARRAMEIAGMRRDARPIQIQTAPPAPPAPIPAATFAMLRKGIGEIEFAEWCNIRHFDIETIQKIEGIGYWPRKAATMFAGKLCIMPGSVVWWDRTGWAKAIPLADDGYRDKRDRRNATINGTDQWQPCDLSMQYPIVLTEGETAALALMSCGIQAQPLKPTATGMARIRDMIARGYNIFLGYDADDAGRRATDDAQRVFPQLPDISRLWQCGKKPTGEPDPDPNGFVVAIDDRKRAREMIVAEMDKANADAQKRAETLRAENEAKAQSEKQEKKKKPKPRDVCNAFFEGWKYDEFYDECVATDGKRYTEDQAESLAYAATDADVTAIRNAIKNAVKYGIGNQINGLYDHVMQMAESCTDADRGAIDRFCERMGFDPYESRRVRLWLYQVVGRAAIPGEKTDGMLVIVSHEGGMSKTNLFNAVSRAMTGNRKAAQPFAFKGTKDEMLSLATSCVVIIDEIDKIFKKKDVSELKAIITLEGADIRDPYARSARARRFCAVFGATSNDLNPIPTGEGDARRYWVVEPKRQIDITTPECESMLREAARDVISELDAHAAEYDKNSVVGKIWVETKEEYRETVARNNGRKSSSSASIALETAARYVAMQPDAPWKDAPCSQGSIASCVETGSLEPMQVPSAQGTWNHPLCNSQEVSRLIGQRLGKRKTAYVYGVGKRSGFTWRDIIAEFLPPDEDNGDGGADAHFDDAPISTTYGGYYNGY